MRTTSIAKWSTPKPVNPCRKASGASWSSRTLKKQALPLLRYRTHDITRLIKEPCKCGRTTMRMQKIAGRSDDMLIIRGVNVFPSQIEMRAASAWRALAHTTRSSSRKKGFMDQIEVRVELTDEQNLLDNFAELEAPAQPHRTAAFASICQLDMRDHASYRPTRSSVLRARPRRVTDLRNQ